MTEDEISFGVTDMMATLSSRQQVWWLLSECGVFATTFVPGQPDLSAYNEGRRSVALQLIERLEKYAPGSVDLMKKEAKSVQVDDAPATRAGKRRQRRRSAAAASRDDYNPIERDAASGDATGPYGNTGSFDD